MSIFCKNCANTLVFLLLIFLRIYIFSYKVCRLNLIIYKLIDVFYNKTGDLIESFEIDLEDIIEGDIESQTAGEA